MIKWLAFRVFRYMTFRIFVVTLTCSAYERSPFLRQNEAEDKMKALQRKLDELEEKVFTAYIQIHVCVHV